MIGEVLLSVILEEKEGEGGLGREKEEKTKPQKITVYCSHLPRTRKVQFPTLPKWNHIYSTIGPGKLIFSLPNTKQKNPSRLLGTKIEQVSKQEPDFTK